MARSAPQWRRVTKFYRRPLGLAWLVALVVIPLLLGAIGYGMQDRPASWATGPTSEVSPLTRPPAITWAPAAVVRDGNNITLSGEFPDQKARAALVDAVANSLPRGVSLIDRLRVSPDVEALDFTDAGKVFDAATTISDFRLTLQGDTITLAGTAPTADARHAVEQAARDTWPNVTVVNTLKSPGPQGDCSNPQQAIAGALTEPIMFGVNAAQLTADKEQELTALADRLKACPNVRITVNGYSDNTGDDNVNGPLSAERARAVTDYLLSTGVSPEQLNSNGLGSASPIADNATPEGRARNRRVEIVVS